MKIYYTKKANRYIKLKSNMGCVFILNLSEYKLIRYCQFLYNLPKLIRYYWYALTVWGDKIDKSEFVKNFKEF